LDDQEDKKKKKQTKKNSSLHGGEEQDGRGRRSILSVPGDNPLDRTVANKKIDVIRGVDSFSIQQATLKINVYIRFHTNNKQTCQNL